MKMKTMKYVVNYYRIKDYLRRQRYTPDEERSVLRKLRNMDTETFNAFLKWFAEGDELPTEPIHGVNVNALVSYRGMTPLAAFLAADWMGRDPVSASRMLSRGFDSVEGEPEMEIPTDIKAIVAKIEKTETENTADEDCSDFVTRDIDDVVNTKKEE